MTPNLIVMSVPTSADGASAAATFSFATAGYQRPHQKRALGMDEVHNQNGHFRYFYDQGPGAWDWAPFKIVYDDAVANLVGGGATQQKTNLDYLWQWTGLIGLQTPDGTYQVKWAPGQDYEPAWINFPAGVGDKIGAQGRVTVQFVQAG